MFNLQSLNQEQKDLFATSILDFDMLELFLSRELANAKTDVADLAFQDTPQFKTEFIKRQVRYELLKEFSMTIKQLSDMRKPRA